MNPLTTQTVAALQAVKPALATVPPEKLGKMLARTLLGSFFVLLGLALLLFVIALPAITAFRDKVQPSFSMTSLVFGVGLPVALGILGAQVWSSQLVTKPIALTIAAFKGIWQTVKGSNAPQS